MSNIPTLACDELTAAGSARTRQHIETGRARLSTAGGRRLDGRSIVTDPAELVDADVEWACELVAVDSRRAHDRGVPARRWTRGCPSIASSWHP